MRTRAPEAGESEAAAELPIDRGLFHPLCAAPFCLWVRLLIDHGGVDRGAYRRAVFVTLYTLLSPARVTARWPAALRYGRRVRRTRIDPPPIFIIGHWRSGTTYLHEMMCRDPALAAPTMWQTMAPRSFLAADHLKRWFAPFVPAQRPMDNVPMHLDAPQEDEVAMATLSRWSFLHTLYFPRGADRQFERGVLFEGLGPRELRRWKRAYTSFLRAVMLANDGRRLVLKNPANTARIPALLDMFPEARFIHIHRNPWEVYASTRHPHLSMPGRVRMQRQSVERIERRVLEQYERLMRRYFEHRGRIAPGRLAEVRFDDLEADPVGELRRVYDRLGLEGFDRAAAGIEALSAERAGYQRNRFELDPRTVRRVAERWAFTIERWGYEPPAGAADG